MQPLSHLLTEVRKCTLCQASLPHEPRPVVQLASNAKILIVGQAPGRKVYESGIPFDDASGNRLREWMGISRDDFYDPEKIAIIPMGFCFPGTGKSGDLPPRPECALAWRDQLLEQLKQIELTLVIGQYAQSYQFGKDKQIVTELVRSWRSYWPRILPLPHPSPRNNIWLRKNSWFEKEVLPPLQSRVCTIIS